MSMCSIWRSIITSTVLVFGLCAAPCSAACISNIPQDLATPAPQDPVARVLAAQSTCPKNAVEWVDALKRAGARMEPTVVNFAGFHNPDEGAFFIFEIVSSDGTPPSAITIPRGDLLFGHFTTTRGDQLVSQQSGLAIELIAWDPGKQFYNFYELLDGDWFYRGDSKGILDQIQLLHRQRSTSTSPFGEGPRCAGCHINGGLLQKELAPPHNDWFVQARRLPLGKLRPDAFISGKLADAKDAGELSKVVVASARRLADSPGYQGALAARSSMQERLRPLFCPLEMNIESDSEPFDDNKATLRIPSAFFVDPRLAAADVSVARPHYDAALEKLHSRLPETPGRRVDADHGWLTPVKAHSDMVFVDALIEQGVVDKEFVADVLAVDFTNPVFSKTRCGLLRLVPDKGGADFAARFQGALRGSSLPGASELLANLSDPARNAAFHENRAVALLASCGQRAADPDAVLEWSRLLVQRRVEVSASEISQNPQGRILENPERIVFPVTQPKAVAGRLALTPACRVQ